jgi:transcriptional regulator with XRE-family HTH domain
MPPSTSMPCFGHAFQIVRRLGRMTQEQVGQLMEVERQQIGRYEGGDQRPPLEKLFTFLETLRIAPSQFFSLMETLEQLARQVEDSASQISLWEGIPEALGEVRETDATDRVVQVLYVTDRGDLCLLDDPQVNDSLTDSLRRHRPKREAVLSLHPSSPAAGSPTK